MFDPERLLGQMLGGALGGSLGGKRNRGRNSGSRDLLGTAGKAQLGLGLLGVAMAAWEHYSQNSTAATAARQPAAVMPPPVPPPAPSAGPASPLPPPPPEAVMGDASAATRAAPMLDLRRQEAMLLIRSMIAAAAADGAIDANERAAILDRARNLGDDPQALQFLQRELDNAVSIDELVAQTPRSMATEVYAAAVLAIDIDTDHERQWLQQLAGGLGIDPARRAEIERELGLN